MADAEDLKHGLLRIVAYLPFIARKLDEERPIAERLGLDDLPVVYIDGAARKHDIASMPNGYLHNAAAKLKREGRQPEALAVMEAEIAKREALRER